MTDSPNLKLPYLIAAQAQKHVTHNEALRALDNLVQLSVLDRDLSTPPAAPLAGARYLVAASATGVWAGQTGKIAAFQDGAWQFHAPLEGWLAWVADEDVLVVYTGAAWALASTGGGGSASVNPAPLVGVNATADTTNRLSVNSIGSLFNHPGSGGHQLKINKAAAADSASVLFQTAYSGRAEFGTTGDDNFHVKVSADGAAWFEAVTVKSSNGKVGFGMTPSLARMEVLPSTTAPSFKVGGFLIQSYGQDNEWLGQNLYFDGGYWRYAGNGSGIFQYFSAGNFEIHTAPNNASGAGALATKIPRFTLTNAGHVGIGTMAPGYKLTLDTDSAAKPGTNTWTISSDARLKDNIVAADLARCWQIVKGIPLKRYTWRNDAYTPEQVGDRSKLGWIAQDVQPFFKNAVAPHVFARPPLEDGTVETLEDCLSLNADQIYAAMYGALQHAISRIEDLEGRLASIARQPANAGKDGWPGI